MTISESIIAWLKDFPGGIDADDKVSVDQLSAIDGAYGVFKAPGDVVTGFVGGARDVTAHYLFVCRHPSQTNAMRISNQAWLEELEKWIRSQNLAGQLPELECGRVCTGISISNSYTLQEQSDAGTIYQFSIAINYFEED